MTLKLKKAIESQDLSIDGIPNERRLVLEKHDPEKDWIEVLREALGQDNFGSDKKFWKCVQHQKIERLYHQINREQLRDLCSQAIQSVRVIDREDLGIAIREQFGFEETNFGKLVSRAVDELVTNPEASLDLVYRRAISSYRNVNGLPIYVTEDGDVLA